MGGISFIIYSCKNPMINLEFSKAFMKMQNRGPDSTAYITESNVAINRLNEDAVKMHLSKSEIADYVQYTFMYGYHRLSVNDTSRDGEQPFEDPIMHKMREYPELRVRPKRKLMCNGEIYNYDELVATNEFIDRDLQSSSDVEVILPMYIKYGLEKTLRALNGDFAFVLTENINTFDIKSMNAFVARDPLGIKPMYIITHKKEFFYMFVSELKGVPKHILGDNQFEVMEMPPGTYWSFAEQLKEKSKAVRIKLNRYNDWNDCKSIETCCIKDTDPVTLGGVYEGIRRELRKSVMDRFDLADVPSGVLLSGGFDSCIILSILIKELVNREHDFVEGPLNVFTVDIVGGNTDTDTNTENARRCVEYLEKMYNIDLQHHVVRVDLKAERKCIEGRLEEIIYNIETFDPGMVRSGILYTYLMKYIREQTNVVVLLSGEGLEELCGHFEFNGLDDATMQERSVKLIKHLSKFEILLGDKISGAYGVELRYPFLDKSFVRYMLSIHPRLKRPQAYKFRAMPIEKYIVRKAFDDSNNEENERYLEENLLWRTHSKDRDSEALKEVIDELMGALYTDTQYYNFKGSNAESNNKIEGKEGMHYKKVFERIFGGNANVVVPKFWNELW